MCNEYIVNTLYNFVQYDVFLAIIFTNALYFFNL